MDAQVEGAVKRTEPGVGCVSMRWLDRMEGELGRARLGQFEWAGGEIGRAIWLLGGAGGEPGRAS